MQCTSLLKMWFYFICPMFKNVLSIFFHFMPLTMNRETKKGRETWEPGEKHTAILTYPQLLPPFAQKFQQRSFRAARHGEWLKMRRGRSRALWRTSAGSSQITQSPWPSTHLCAASPDTQIARQRTGNKPKWTTKVAWEGETSCLPQTYQLQAPKW